MRVRAYRIVIFASRVLRWIAWGWASYVALTDLERFRAGLPSLDGAPQEAAFASSILIDVVVAYVVARAAEGVWRLVAEDLSERVPPQ